MTRFDPLRCIVWLSILVYAIAVYAFLFWLCWPAIENALSLVGSLARCEGLTAADCIALAQGGR